MLVTWAAVVDENYNVDGGAVEPRLFPSWLGKPEESTLLVTDEETELWFVTLAQNPNVTLEWLHSKSMEQADWSFGQVVASASKRGYENLVCAGGCLLSRKVWETGMDHVDAIILTKTLYSNSDARAGEQQRPEFNLGLAMAFKPNPWVMTVSLSSSARHVNRTVPLPVEHQLWIRADKYGDVINTYTSD